MITRKFIFILLFTYPAVSANLCPDDDCTQSSLMKELFSEDHHITKVPPGIDGGVDPELIPTTYANLTTFGLALCDKDFTKWVPHARLPPSPETRKIRAINFVCHLMAGDQVDAATCQTDREEKIEELSIEELCQGPLTAIYKDILEGNPNATNQSITDEPFYEVWSTRFGALYETADSIDDWWLFQYFLSSYGQRDFRPIWFNIKSLAVEIEFIFQPKTMTDVDMIAGTFEIIGFLDMEWTDDRIKWDSQKLQKYSHINYLELNDNDIWTPPIKVIDGELEDLNTRAYDGEKVIPLRVTINGKVQMKRFVKITAFCDTGLKVVDYPFDQHNCDIRFGSYDMDNTQLILAIDKWNDFRQIEPSNDRLVEIWDSIKDDSRTVDFSESREWNMTKKNYHYRTEMVMFLMEHLRTQTEHSFIIVSLVLKRTPPFLATTMVAPIILIMLLTNVGLILPCESGEKMGYSITIFLTLVVYMEYISSEIPPWDEFDQTPRIVRFFMMALTILTVILFINANAILQNYPKRAKLKSMSYSRVKGYVKLRTINKVLSLLTLNNHLPICLQNTQIEPPVYTMDDIEKTKGKKRRKSIASKINKIGVGGYEYPLITKDMYNLLIDKRTFKNASYKEKNFFSKASLKADPTLDRPSINPSEKPDDTDLAENVENLTEIWEFTSQVTERFCFCLILYLIIVVTIWAFIVPHVNYYFPMP